MTIYTRRGDEGDTSLADGTRVPKSSARVEAYGTVDEANSAVGLARAAIDDPRLDAALAFMQHKLFNCSSSLATPGHARSERTPAITPGDVRALELLIDEFETVTGPLDHFIIEGGCRGAAHLQFARAVVRRAERRAAALAAVEDVDPQVLAFLNRCSDALFAAARHANRLAGFDETPWDPAARPPR